MKKDIKKALDLIRKETNTRANLQSSRVLKDALTKIGKAMKNFKNVFPGSDVPLGDSASTVDPNTSSGFAISKAEFLHSKENLDPDLQQRLEEIGTKKTRRSSGILGDKSVIRNLRLANLDIAVRLEHLGLEEESLVSGGVIYVNLDHPLYRTYQKDDNLLTLHLARILTKELTLQAGITGAEQAFALQANLLADALKEKGA